mgnify:CR=1 FL=1
MKNFNKLNKERKEKKMKYYTCKPRQVLEQDGKGPKFSFGSEALEYSEEADTEIRNLLSMCSFEEDCKKHKSIYGTSTLDLEQSSECGIGTDHLLITVDKTAKEVAEALSKVKFGFGQKYRWSVSKDKY